ncbi:MAG: aminoacyl-tRNA hydrolase [Pseudomonadota bacterium]
MLLLVGLGNPGDKYAKNRHNVGFMAADAIAEGYGFAPERRQFQGLVREGFFETDAGRAKTLILKPQTFMNDSGRSVGEAVRFFKIPPENVIVLYDELDLAPGKVRVKIGGGAAGHNGVKSLAAHIGPDFKRVRIGIGHPGDKSKVHAHVLKDFSKAEQQWLAPLLDGVVNAAPRLAAGEDARFMSDVAMAVAPQKKQPEKAHVAKASPKQPASDKNEAPAPHNNGPLAAGLKKLFGKE